MKAISSGFEAELTKNVLRMAEVITLTRTDGYRVHLTNHDEPITVDGVTYRNDISFVLSAVRSDSSLASDNTTMEAGLDGEVLVKEDFRNGLWKKASLEIAEVHFEDLSLGKVVIRRGLIRQIEVRGNNTVRMDIDGLLKVLDFEIGRVYVPGCDAELGDKRCRVALDFSQARSYLNPYREGDWVYWYDETELTTQAGTNFLFDADGDRTAAQAITGWTKSVGATFVVQDTTDHPDGLRSLIGATSTAGRPEEQSVYQDITLSADAADIDDGKILLGLFFDVSHRTALSNFGKVRVDLVDTSGDILASDDTGWFQLDAVNGWRGRAVVQTVPPGARTARIHVFTRRTDGSAASLAFTNFRARYWDHTVDDPTHGLIFKCANASEGGGGVSGSTRAVGWQKVPNHSFELDDDVNSSDPITGWTRVSGTWTVNNNNGGPAALGNKAAIVTNAGGAIRTNRVDLRDYPANIKFANIDNVDKIVTMRVATFFDYDGNNVADFTTTVRFYAADGTTLLSTQNRSTAYPNPFITADAGAAHSVYVTVVPNTRFMEIEITVGSGEGAHKIDGVLFAVISTSARPNIKTTIQYGEVSLPSFGLEETEPVYTAGEVTNDDGLIWKAHTQHVQFDEVDTVTSRKEFTAVTMTGAAGDYTSTKIKWLSGDNAGLENIIRIFTDSTQTVKMYFSLPFDIQPGDRFMYVQGCQKRFSEDCRVRFDNAINFRGFPFVPGNTDV